MKRKFLLVCCIILALYCSACGSTKQTAVDLKGEWSQDNDSDGMKHVATITDSSIEIYWLDEENETKSLYWCGSFVPPDENSKKYEWESVNDKEKTGSALLASSDETKKFTYEKGQIIYEASAFGVTKTVRLEKTTSSEQIPNATATQKAVDKSKTKAERISERLVKYVGSFGEPQVLYLAVVQNTDNKPLEFGNVTIDIKDKNGSMIKHIDTANVYPRYIMPGEKGYICEECTRHDTNIVLDDVDSAEMHFGTRKAEYSKPNVEITELRLVKRSTDWCVLGKVKSEEEIEDLFIYFPVFDENSELQTVALASVEGLSAGDERGFECALLDYDPAVDFSNAHVEAIPCVF